jgi:putative cofactor-binding repeat protein
MCAAGRPQILSLMKSAKMFQAALASVTFLAVSAIPAAGETTASGPPESCGTAPAAALLGADDPAVDVPAVQAAVNTSRSVRLQGTFDFGVSGTVLVRCDVEISGETDPSGAVVTIIRRGQWDFHTPYPSVMPPPVAGPIVAIKHIHFAQSMGTAIHLAYSGGAAISGNVIDDMRARPVGAVAERAAIVVGPALLGGPANSSFFPNLVSGAIEVSDNRVDVSGPESTTTTRATGMFVSMYVGADVRIERNFVTGNTRTGLAILDGTFDASGRGSVVIADNVIRTDVRQGFIQGLGPRAPIGIVTGFNNQRVFGSDPKLVTIPVVIDNNTIEVGDPSETGLATSPMGIINIWNGALITNNTITVHGHSASTTDRLSTSGGILATTSHQALKHNTVSGEGCNAIRIGGTVLGQERVGNVGIANNITHFQAIDTGFANCTDVWLEPASHDNTIVGNSGSVIDDGVDNSVTGFGPVKGGVGGAVSQAVQDVNDLSVDFE